MSGKPESRRASDSDFVIPVHTSKLDVLDKKSIDFEERLRKLESYQSSFNAVKFANDLEDLKKYQSEQKGFFAANKLWITIFVVMLLNAAITVAIKVYVRQDAPQQTTAPKLSSQTI